MIRDATEEDIKILVDIGESFWATTEYARDGAVYSKERALSSAMLCIKNGFALVSDNEGLDGMALFLIAPSCFSDDKGATEMVFFVSPGKRGAGIGRSLLEAARIKALESGCNRISVGNMFGSSPESSDSLFKSMGFHIAETTYTMKV